MIGTRLGHYTIDGLLGEGGMGAVYRARDTVLDRTVALKILTRSAEGDAESIQRLLHEARAASALNHPNIVTIHAVERAGDVDFIVMEHVAGTSLASAIPAGGLPVDRAIEYACQIAQALAVAHEAGIVHRDIKPANVLVAPTGQVKVLDFGIARRSALATDALTRTGAATIAPPGAVVGTIGYLSPEQVAGKPADVRSDVFSLGVVVFEMLTGTQPFRGQSTWAVMDAIVRQEPPRVDTVRPDVPDGLVRIVTRCLAKDPRDRYATALELRDELEAVRAARAGRRGARNSYAVPVVAASVAVALVLAAVLVRSRVRDSRVRWARETAVPEVSRLADAGDALAAFRLASLALARAPDDPQVRAAWNQATHAFPVTSEPPGATVEVRAYGGNDEGWIRLGVTPIDARLPMGLMRWRVTKEGYETLEVAPNTPPFAFTLTPAGTSPAGMVHVPAGSLDLESETRRVALPEYFIDTFEVTNREFKAFVDAGGYRNAEYWTEPFVKDGVTLSFDEAMAEFRDSTGRPGPSTWELGTYPDGQGERPVGGVSWYEAAAYAAWAGKRLPTVYHWYRASGAFGLFSEILKFSNFTGRGPERVGASGGLGPYGTYDMAGNVKEWCWNATTGGRRYLLGGGWNDANYQFRDQDAQPPFDRAPSYGFRCIGQREALDAGLLEPIVSLAPDPSSLKPVGPDVYEAYRRLYDYDAVPLESRVDEEDDTSRYWRQLKVSFRAAYGDERVPAYLYLPRDATPPLQAVVYFPGGDALLMRSSRDLYLRWVEFVVRSGRAVIYPIYQQTYERQKETRGPNFLREISIQRGLDVRRAVDYLESRPDVDRARLAYYGLSLGAQLGPVYLAIEPRFRTGVLLSGGLEVWDIPPESDPVNFAPRVTQPVLMVNGREDFDLPYETSQLPLFHLLGTSDKRHAVLEGGHIPPRPQPVYKEILDWLDQHLGPVAR